MFVVEVYGPRGWEVFCQTDSPHVAVEKIKFCKFNDIKCRLVTYYE